MGAGNKFYKFFDEQEYQIFAELTNESIEMFGCSAYYVPKKFIALDNLFGEDAKMEFTTKYEIYVYVKYVDSWPGAGHLFSKFGFQSAHEAEFDIGKAKFYEYTGLDKPAIGDLIVIPWGEDHDIFEISFVDPHTPFYHLGNIATWPIKCARWRYNHEKFTAVEQQAEDIALAEENDDFMSDNANLKTENDASVKDFTEDNPFGI